ncbi:hypothetical protein Tco_1562229 [Tanacetum coccineum]
MLLMQELSSGTDPEPCKRPDWIKTLEKLHVSLVDQNPEHMDDEFLATAYPKQSEEDLEYLAASGSAQPSLRKMITSSKKPWEPPKIDSLGTCFLRFLYCVKEDRSSNSYKAQGYSNSFSCEQEADEHLKLSRKARK